MKKAMFIIFLVFWSMVLCCQPNIKFDTMLIDFGNIQQTSGVIKGKFHFTNTGTKPLLINKVQSSGGILSVIDYTRDTIYMNKSGTISFMCSITSSSIQTSFTKSISIYSNVINSPHVVLVKGAILPYSEENNTLESYGFSITGFENYGYTLQIDTTNVDEIIARSEIIGHFNLVNNNDSIIELKNFGWSIDNMAFKSIPPSNYILLNI